MSAPTAIVLAADLLEATALHENRPHLDALFGAAALLIASLEGKPPRPVRTARRRKRRRSKRKPAIIRRAGRRAAAETTPPAPKETPAAKPKAAGESPAPETIVTNDVSVVIAHDVAAVAFNGSAIDCTAKDGRVIVCLARAMPHPIGGDFVASKVRGLGPDPQGWLNGLVRRKGPALASIGLRLQSVGVTGFSLQKMGE